MKTLPPNMHAPEVEETVRNFKQMIGGQAIDAVLDAKRTGNSVTGCGAIAMMGLLDAALEHWLVWHQAQGKTLDEEAFYRLVKERMSLASANVEGFGAGRPPAGGLQ